MDLLILLYPWIKTIHILAVISWMAGMLYLPRLFVYHVETDSKNLNYSETIVRWEFLLIKRIMGPAMIVTWLFGLLLILVPNIIDWSQGWIWVKLLCVIGMTGFHGFLSKQRKLLEKNERPYTGKQYRFLNEVPTILMIIIVIMVVVRPF